jgi:hypothetical protein
MSVDSITDKILKYGRNFEQTIAEDGLTKYDRIYRKLKTKKSKIVFGHCRTCIDDMPIGVAPKDWARLEVIIDLETGLLVVGCRRCNLHVVTAMVDSRLVKHMNKCGCEQCEFERQQTKH